MVDGKINIEKFAKRLPDETNEQFEERIWDYIKSPFCKKQFTERQEMHYKFSDKYVPGRSYYTETLNVKEIQELLYKGELAISRLGDWRKQVIIKFSDKKGIVVLLHNGGGEISTYNAQVHISNRGIHVVPKKEK